MSVNLKFLITLTLPDWSITLLAHKASVIRSLPLSPRALIIAWLFETDRTIPLAISP